MQQAQRVFYNHALKWAITLANQEGLPLLVFFGLDPQYPDGNIRHFTFMIEGLFEVRTELKNRGIGFTFVVGPIWESLKPLLSAAHAVVSDIGYLRYQREIRKMIYYEIIENHPDIDYYTVESDAIIPVRAASDKAEYGAYTFRPKVNRLKDIFLEPFSMPKIHEAYIYDTNDALDSSLIEHLKVDRSTPATLYFRGGHSEARLRLDRFIDVHLPQYESSNDPGLDVTSKLSPYLHFGQISALEIYHAIHAVSLHSEAVAQVLEQLLVRRELAINYVYYQDGYDDFHHMTEPWAYRTMIEHQDDPRPYLYTENDYVRGETHDIYFNAAMKEMTLTGFMHGYMRMYWAKKIIEWSPSYLEAFRIITHLNNRYFLDGRDPTSYASIAWCFGKHDRPWQERPVFGKLRYMNQNGLKRKFAIDLYAQRMDALDPSSLIHHPH